MKKAEMEHHRAEYEASMVAARLNEQNGMYFKAVELALASWDHIDGMMQYGRRYQDKEFASIQGIDMILKYAPLLLDFASLETLASLLNSCRRIEKGTSDSMGEKLAEARERMWEAHRLWDHLEQQPGAKQDQLRRLLGGDQDRWRWMAEAWEKMGLLERRPEGGSYRLALSTRMGMVVNAKCPSCGNIARAPKAMFLERLPCTECEEKVVFVILPSETVTDSKE
jgi:hypothetical protein